MAGIKVELIYTLRHAFATHLVNNGADLRVGAASFGSPGPIYHRGIYTHVAKERLKQLHTTHIHGLELQSNWYSKRSNYALVGMGFAFVSVATMADEARIRKAITSINPMIQIKSVDGVVDTPFFEVILMSGERVYTDESGLYFVTTFIRLGPVA